MHIYGCRISGGRRISKTGLNRNIYAYNYDQDYGYNHDLDKDL
jgi:hypothetical protein